MLRWLGALVVAAILSCFAFLLLTGHYVDEGRVIIAIAPGRGLHLGDVFILVAWFVGVLGCLTLGQSSYSRPRSRGAHPKKRKALVRRGASQTAEEDPTVG
jgi:hypothetical protein